MLNIVKKVKFDFLCWKIMSLTDQNCVDWRWALSFAQHTPVSMAFKNQTTLCGMNQLGMTHANIWLPNC